MEGRTLFTLFLVIGFTPTCYLVEGLGVNWGSMASHKLRADIVVQILKDNGIGKVKLFDSDDDTLKSFAGTNIEVMVAIPNDQLEAMNDYQRAKKWVKQNVSTYHFNGGVNITYVAVGNEPFLSSYNGTFQNITVPALKNIQRALNEQGFGSSVKATVPLNADVYNSPESNPVPSAGTFRSDISDLMKEMVSFLHENGAPFTVNIYPFLSLYGNDDFPIEYAFFDGGRKIPDGDLVYTNVFDANFDTLVAALAWMGYGNMPILVGEVGWPTDGDKNANVLQAQRFYDGLLPRLASGRGTPRRPGMMEVYLFALLDENIKSVAPGSFERHWGILRYDGQPKYPMDVTGGGKNGYLVGGKGVKYLKQRWCTVNENATESMMSRLSKNVDFACTFSDCTSLEYGSSCNGMDGNANASFAFNAYYQNLDQKPSACDFEGLAVITDRNISTPFCNFNIQIVSGDGESRWPRPALFSLLSLAAAVAAASEAIFMFP